MARKIKWDDDIGPKLLRAEARMQAFLYASCAYHARKGQAYAKQYARWTDRTGNARSGLAGKAFKDGRRYSFVIFGTAPYQPWLEIRFSGRYAVIRPTITHESRGLMTTVARAYDTIFGG